jgi:hypothetical protein
MDAPRHSWPSGRYLLVFFNYQKDPTVFSSSLPRQMECPNRQWDSGHNYGLFHQARGVGPTLEGGPAGKRLAREKDALVATYEHRLRAVSASFFDGHGDIVA